MWKPLTVAALILAAVVIALAVLWSKGTSKETIQVVRGEAIRAVYATGTVEPVHFAALSPHKTGRIEQILKDEGDAVQAGEVLARLDSQVEQAHLAEAQARLDFLKEELQRKEALFRRGAATGRARDDVRREYQEAEARLASIRRGIEDLALVSPMAGTLIRRDVEPGETVQAGQRVLVVGTLTPLRVTAEVDEEDIGRVATGQRALIKADAFPDQVFEGQVSEITPQGDPVNKVFRVRVALPDDTRLKSGMTAEVNIITERIGNALLVPVESEAGGRVWRLEGRRVREVSVTVGIRGEKQVQILEGVEEGDALLAAPPAKAK